MIAEVGREGVWTRWRPGCWGPVAGSAHLQASSLVDSGDGEQNTEVRTLVGPFEGMCGSERRRGGKITIAFLQFNATWLFCVAHGLLR